jgi:hypothetical protein
MNSAPAELLQLLTNAALQPYHSNAAVKRTAPKHKICHDVLPAPGRILSSVDQRRSHITVLFQIKNRPA